MIVPYLSPFTSKPHNLRKLFHDFESVDISIQNAAEIRDLVKITWY